MATKKKATKSKAANASKSSKKSKEDFSFAEGFARLESIVEKCESGDLSLDDNLQQFEEGLQVAAQLQEQLRSVESTIEELKKKYSTDAD